MEMQIEILNGILWMKQDGKKKKKKNREILESLNRKNWNRELMQVKVEDKY